MVKEFGKDYKPKNCESCGNSFKPNSSVQRFCENCSFPVDSKEYKLESWRRIARNPKNRAKMNSVRQARRKRIQEAWGYVGGLKGTWVNTEWEKSEEIALEILEHEGFKNPRRLNYFRHHPFDVRADGISVFQVTMRTHIEDKRRHLRLADDLSLSYWILYIKPDFSGYVLKDAMGEGADELNLTDIKEMKKWK